jgi:hypothetical protein
MDVVKSDEEIAFNNLQERLAAAYKAADVHKYALNDFKVNLMVWLQTQYKNHDEAVHEFIVELAQEFNIDLQVNKAFELTVTISGEMITDIDFEHDSSDFNIEVSAISSYFNIDNYDVVFDNITIVEVV